LFNSQILKTNLNLEINADIEILGLKKYEHASKKLLYQLPKQDLKRDTCTFLNDKAARKRFEKFTSNRNANALNIAIRAIRNDTEGFLNLVRWNFININYLSSISLDRDQNLVIMKYACLVDLGSHIVKILSFFISTSLPDDCDLVITGSTTLSFWLCFK